MKIAVIGGGAAGFFAALCAKSCNPGAEVDLFERSAKLLTKVQISGGGRCNVTHHEFDPKRLVAHYPRGNKELLGPFHQFQPRDTISWFKERGVDLKTEGDGRMFPTTDHSSTIIRCFLKEGEKLGVKIHLRQKLEAIQKKENTFFLTLKGESPIPFDKVILATGSSSGGWELAKNFGHTIQDPVPSLFTFNVPTFPLVSLAGISAAKARVSLEGSRFVEEGPLLITHWGFSGPAVLKLSAFAARYLAKKQYKTHILIDWVPDRTHEELLQTFLQEKREHPSQKLGAVKQLPFAERLLKALCQRADVDPNALFRSLSNKKLAHLAHTLKQDRYLVQGKTTHKEEFVTCGGITLSEVDFKTMESRIVPGLHFCGEILDIDGVTGGFNFQNAWTTGFLAGRAAT